MTPRASFLLFVLAGCARSGTASAAPLRDSVDERELRAMRDGAPHALELLEKGDARSAGGHYKEAQALFRQAHTEFPDASILWRRDCEALIALGQRQDAILTCSNAVTAFRSGANVRALVSAFVDGPTPPSSADVLQALLLTANERHYGPSATVAAATCDIAERIGDGMMLQGCADELQRLAPNDPATRKALSALDARCPPWRFWTGWGAIAALVFATMGHALWQWLRKATRARKTPRVAAAVTLAILLCALPRVARAGADETGHMLSKWHVDESDPVAHIPEEKDRNAEPMEFGYWIQDCALKGERASKHGDHLSAARFYEALAVAVPERAIGFVKACEEYEASGDIDSAIRLCGDALLRDGLRVKDYTHFVHLMLAKRGRMSSKETAALAQVIQHMKDDPAGRQVADELECEVGSRTSNVTQLKECTAALAARAPDDASTISYLWVLAMLQGNTTEAEALLRRAQAAGVKPEDIDRMKKETSRNALMRAVRSVVFTLAIGGFITGIAVAIRAFLARRRSAPEGNVPAPAA